MKRKKLLCLLLLTMACLAVSCGKNESSDSSEVFTIKGSGDSV